MTVTVWTMPECPRCDRVKETLRAGGFAPLVKELAKLRSGTEPDVDAMAHLIMSGELAPIVLIGGQLLEPDEVDQLIEGNLECLNSNCHIPPP